MDGLIDTHCHILFGVDDGAKTEEDSWGMLLQERENDVSAVILTPHYRRSMFEPPMERVLKRYEYLKEQVNREHLPIQIFLGCEYHWSSEMIPDLDAGRRPTLAGGKYVLVEFSSVHTFDTMRDAVYRLLAAGYLPVIAHIERYPKIAVKLNLVEELQELGAWIQITSSAVLGKNGWRAKRVCANLLKNKLVHLIASDAHDRKHRKTDLGSCYDFVLEKYGREYTADLFMNNPGKIIQNENKAEY